MAAGAVIRIDQLTGAGAGTAGKSRNDIWIGKQVDLVSAYACSSYAWYMLSVPKGSSATLSSSAGSSVSLTPDVVGTYRVRLIVNGGGPNNTQTKVIRCRYDSSGTLTERGWALPAFGEEEDSENDYGTPANDRGWAEPIESMRDDLLTILAGVSGGNMLVYQPGGGAADNVYTSWVALVAAAAGLNGPTTVFFDSTYGLCEIPSGIHECINMTFVGYQAIIVVRDGAVLNNLQHITGDMTVYSSSTGPIFDWTTSDACLELADRAILTGETYDSAPSSPLITKSSVHLILRDMAQLLSLPVLDQPILYAGSGSGTWIDAYDSAVIAASDGSDTPSNALKLAGTGSLLVRLFDQGVTYNNISYAYLSAAYYSNRQVRIPISSGVQVNSATTPASCGACVVDNDRLPAHVNVKCYFHAVLETTDATVPYAAYIDLYDTQGTLNSGTPQVVPSSQMDTATGSPPSGAPLPNPLIASVYETDLTVPFQASWNTAVGVFEARLWIGTAAVGKSATCKSAELIFEW